jgi:cyclopropane-fatty-acyl-phospholipid synthase
MLYKFKSKVTGDLIMLEPNGRQILNLVGKDNQTKGILLPQEMTAAIAALEQAIAQDEALLEQRRQAAQAAGESLPRADTVTLRQRAVPFIDMLKQCHKADKEVVWGV